MVMDPEQLHCSTDLLFQVIKVHKYQKGFRQKHLQLNLTEDHMLPWPDPICAKKELQNHHWLIAIYAFILSP